MSNPIDQFLVLNKSRLRVGEQYINVYFFEGLKMEVFTLTSKPRLEKWTFRGREEKAWFAHCSLNDNDWYRLCLEDKNIIPDKDNITSVWVFNEKSSSFIQEIISLDSSGLEDYLLVLQRNERHSGVVFSDGQSLAFSLRENGPCSL